MDRIFSFIQDMFEARCEMAGEKYMLLTIQANVPTATNPSGIEKGFLFAIFAKPEQGTKVKSCSKTLQSGKNRSTCTRI